jgi:hypothetical protein
MPEFQQAYARMMSAKLSQKDRDCGRTTAFSMFSPETSQSALGPNLDALFGSN